jgi:hypothetical protein
LSPPLLDQDASVTVTLAGREWLTIWATLSAGGAQLKAQGIEEGGLALLDLLVKIIKQIDPSGWQATDA